MKARTFVTVCSAGLLVAVLAAGCGDDGGAATDAGVDGSRKLDGSTDAGAGDAAAGDAAADAGIDAATGDGGVNCAVVGCGAPTVCGEACDAPCGCCPCGNGTTVDRGGVEYVCVGGCYVENDGSQGTDCAGPGDCGDGLSCCYPCGVAGCTDQCAPTCANGAPGCYGGCFAYP